MITAQGMTAYRVVQKKSHISLMLVFALATALIGCAGGSQKLPLKIVTVPDQALVTVHQNTAPYLQVGGTTPIEKELTFKKGRQTRVRIQKRGYKVYELMIDAQSRNHSISLTPVTDDAGAPIPAYAFPNIKRLLVAVPDFKVILRGFSSETISALDSQTAIQSIYQGLEKILANRFEVISAQTVFNHMGTSAVWRDARTLLEFVDPVTLPFSTSPPYLETSSARRQAQEIGHSHQAEAILFVFGKQNIETAGMVAGKISMGVLGTATSYTSAYHNAMARGDSFFVYNVYTPDFKESTSICAILVDCQKGEVVWVNKGLWPAFSFEDDAPVEAVLTDLLRNFN